MVSADRLHTEEEIPDGFEDPEKDHAPLGNAAAMRWWALSLNALLLGVWLGGWTLFAFVVAPVAFRTLPSSADAGKLVGPVLDFLHIYGIAAGIGMSGLAAFARQSWTRVLLPLVLAGICAASQFGVTGAIDEIRPAAFGAGSSAEAAARFSQLHELSRLLYGITGAGLVILTVIWARRDS